MSFTYDPVYNRRATMVDGIGTTAYTYYSPGALGAGRVSGIDGPLANDTTSYSYDELGRVTSRQINGSSNTVTTAYDVLGRVATEANTLGSFTYAYVGVTGRVSGLTYPNGQTTSYSYFDNAADHRLQQVHHRLSGGATLSKFDYTYDAAGNIKTWSQQRGANPATVQSFGYDAAQQLVAASRAPAGTAPNRFGYAYDSAGNRNAEQLDDAVTGATYNNLNQLLSQQPGGALLFRGTVNEPATVTIGGTPAQVGTDNSFAGSAAVASGTSTVAVVATDPSGNARTNTYQVSQSGTSRIFIYDPNGNLTSDGARTYEWDAENRLLRTWTGASCSANPSTCSEFTYDGEGRRVRLLEKTNGSTTSDKTYVWAGTEIAEERNTSDNTVTKRYFGVGVEDGGDHFYVKDHLGSIVDMTDSAGAVQASYDYDPYGRRTKVSGSGDAPMGYTGHFHHAASGLDLAVYRAYDASIGRWISPDPIGLGGGVNFYAYADNAPIANVDPLGLLTGPCSAAESAKTGALCRERGMVLLTCVHHEINFFGVAWVSWASYTCESPFGNCTPIRHATLQLAVNTACKSGPSACTASQTCAQLKANMATNLACAVARNQINNQCYGGGNPGHQQAAANA
ncbi:MAG: RHS repeat-associated core domain-containing protein, partial [Acidimicrobiia bacterium]